MQKNVMSRLDDILGSVSQKESNGSKHTTGDLEGKG
jgi:hypothetical protein